MSSYSFSHQFYQRWTCAPEPIRASIIQELTDITTLLKAETPFETFVFSTHDLDAHLDDLYENHEAEQAIAKAIADKQAAEQLIFEQQRLEEEQKIKAAEETKRQEEAHLTKESRLKEQALEERNKPKEAENTQKEAEKETLFADDKNRLETAIKLETADADETEIDDKVDTIINDESDNEEHIANSKTISEHANAIDDGSIKNDSTIKNDSSINAINNKASLAISLAVKDAKLSVTHKDLIHELEMQIDDYLSDQMMLMSENLKSWLRAEMTQHLSEQDKNLSNGNPPKN